MVRNQIAKILGKLPDEIIIGFTSSSFDLGPHAGHCAMLMEAKANCDWLVVALLVDPSLDRPQKNKPIQSIFERYIQITSNKFIDEVIVIESEKDLIDAILLIQPNVRFCGEEYRDIDHTGKGLCHIHYNSRKHSFSSTDLRQRIKEQL
jgi:glycerol-3-phosphate cytidylyltransferase